MFTGQANNPSYAKASVDLTETLCTLDRLHKIDVARTNYVATHPPEKKRNTLQRLWHDYGWVGVGTHITLYLGTLGMLYVAVRSGALGADTVMNLVTKLGLESHFDGVDSKKGDFIVAWIATKLTEPPRAVVTLAITPKLARMLGRAPPKGTNTKPTLKEEIEKTK